jgi:hypothetical protein
VTRRIGIRRPHAAGHRPAGLVKAAGPTTLPGGVTIPAGSQVTDATSMLGALQGRTAMGVNGATPLPRDEQFWALMGPGSPLYSAPLNVPNLATGQADPRRYEYPVSWNLIQDAGRLVDWSTLRSAAREVDIIAQCIRVRRTEQSSLEWDITPTRRTIEANGIKSTQDKNTLLEKYSGEIARLVEFWSEPDTTNGYTWPEWLEMLIHESLVTDAVSIYPRFTYGGDLSSLELIDGSTVKPLLDERGNRPHRPAPAYQQWLYGFPRGEYTDSGAGEPDWSGDAGSLIYKPRYTRVESPYGYSPVEQALVSAELWLRRQQWMVAEYTEGTTPRTFLKATGIPMTPEQQRAWEDSLNDFYGGSTSRRHRLRLFPDGFDPVQIEDAAERYKPDYDEFLVKLICAHMDVQPQEIGFTPRNGLGGSGHGESQEAITYRKALRPTAQWLVGIMNQISYAYLGMPRDLTFQFLGMESEDEDGADQTVDRQFRAGRVTLNETRDEAGLPRYDFAEADMPMIVSQRGVVFLENASTLFEPGEEITPAQAPPMTEPPEGADSTVGSTVPVAQQKKQPAGPPAEEQDAQKAELAAFRKFISKRGKVTRPFQFKALDAEYAAELNVLAEYDPDRALHHARPENAELYLSKASDAGPKLPSGRTWPGWSRDLAVAKHWAPKLSQALTGAINTRDLAERWLSVRKAADPSDAQLWLDAQAIPVGQAIGSTLRNIHTEGYIVGQRSALAMTANLDVSWDNWTPGDPAAAEALIGDDMGLQRLLNEADVTINSIAQNRLDDLAQALADGLDSGDSVDEIAAALTGVLDDASWAYMVALTETTRAVSYATQQTYLANGIQLNNWITALDQRVCVACDQNEAYGDVPVGQDFPSGQSMPPAHPSCFPAGVLVTGPSAVAATARVYEGDLVTVVFASGKELSVTPNHPVLTPDGWVPAGDLHEGREVLRAWDPERVASLIYPHDRQAVARIEDVARTLRESGQVASIAMPAAAEDFHGDGTPGHQVDVVFAAGDTEFDVNTDGSKQGRKLRLLEREADAVLGLRNTDAHILRHSAATDALVSGLDHVRPLLGGGVSPSDSHGLTAVAGVDASIAQHPRDGVAVDAVADSKRFDGLAAEERFNKTVGSGSNSSAFPVGSRGYASIAKPGANGGMADAEGGRHLVHRLAGLVEPDRVSQVLRSPNWSGHVFNLETVDGWYFADGIIAHNCRCALAPVV